MPLVLPIRSELDERSAAAAADRAQRIYSQAAQDMGRSMSEGITRGARDGGRAIERMADDARAAYKRVGDATDELREQENQLKQMRADGARGVEVQAERVRRARRAEKEAIKDATDALEEYERAARGAGDAGAQAGGSMVSGLRSAAGGAAGAGQDFADSFAGGFAGAGALTRMAGMALPGLGWAAAGVAAGKLFADGVADGLATNQMRDYFQGRMGLDETSMAQYATAAGAAYANNFGASVADNLAATQAALRTGIIDPSSTNAEIQAVIEQLQGVSTLTDATAEELSRSFTTLMRTGLAGSVSEASDIIVAGFQNGLDVSGDWLDTINEYSTQFRKLGIDASEVLTLLNQGIEGGARDTDKVADSLKEFSIRAVDGSQATAEGFEALGFNADDMAARFAQGGESARQAFAATLDALRGLNDPMQQALAWQRLFGTQFEDMGDAVNRLDLDPAKNEFRDLEGVAGESTKTATDNWVSQWETALRTAETRFTDFKSWLADAFTDLPGVKQLPGFVNWALTPPGFNMNGPSGPSGEMPSGYTPANPLDAFGRPASPTTAGPTPPRPLGPTTQGWSPLDIFAPTAAPPGTPPAPGAPVPGERNPILTDTQQEALDALTGGAGKSLPPAPVLPLQYSSTAGMSTQIANATTRLDEAEHSVAEKQARVDQLRQTNIATEEDIQRAENDLAQAEQRRQQAEQSLQDAKANQLEQMVKQSDRYANRLQSSADQLDQIGAQLDSDFGISDGLAGIAENITKFVGNLALAAASGPLRAQQMAMGYAPGETGGGLVGIASQMGAFGSQYQVLPSWARDQASSSASPSSLGPAALRPNAAGGMPTKDQVKAIAASFGLDVTSENRPGDPGYHGSGLALDLSNASGNSPQMRAFAEYMSANYGSYLEELIYNEPGWAGNVLNGQPHQYSPGTMADHRDHVHVAAQEWGMPSFGTPGDRMGDNYDAYGAAGMDKQSIAHLVYGMALQRGYSPHDAQSILAYAIGESGLNPGISGGPQGGAGVANEVVGLFQQKPAFAQGGGIDPVMRSDAASNTYAYLNQLEHNRHLPIEQALPATSVGGPLSGVGRQNWSGLMAQAGNYVSGMNASQSVPGGRSWNQGNPSSGGLTFNGGFLGALASSAAGAAGAAGSFGAGGGAASAAIDLGMQVAGRAIGAGSQYVGNAVGGVLETLMLNDSALGDPSSSWVGRILGAVTGVKPALPNSAGMLGGEQNPNMAEGGKKQPPGPLTPEQAALHEKAMGAGGKGEARQGDTYNINTTVNRANEDQTGRVIQDHLAAQSAAKWTNG